MPSILAHLLYEACRFRELMSLNIQNLNVSAMVEHKTKTLVIE